jgi:hypothetical protein
MPTPSLTIASRFNGPPESGNGGYVAGRLAQQYVAEFGELPVHAVVQITLRKPPPLAAALSFRVPEETETLRLLHGTTVIAEAEAVEAPEDGLDVIEPLTFEEAETAAKDYLGRGEHPFLTCFVCGPNHPTGLHVYPGQVPGRRGVVASPWTPAEDTHGSEFVWAALDCPGGWSAGDLAARPMVLGRMSARVEAVPEPGAPCVVLGRHVRTEGRKTFTASTLYGPDGELLGASTAVWIAVDPATVKPASLGS